MESIYEGFLAFENVVRITTEVEWAEFCTWMKRLGLKDIKYLERLSFSSLHSNAGVQTIPYGELCVEFQLGKGFTVDRASEYEEFGCNVISLRDLINDVTAE